MKTCAKNGTKYSDLRKVMCAGWHDALPIHFKWIAKLEKESSSRQNKGWTIIYGRDKQSHN
jgi:hypothetical protein